MTDAPSLLATSAARGDWVRLRTLVMLRWLAAAGQAAAVLVASEILRVDLPIGPCFALIAASACMNLVAQTVHPPGKRLSERDTALTLLFDLGQLGALLFLTGGLTNPFAVLLLAPVTVSATALTLRSTLLLGAFAMAEVSVLAVVYRPLVFADGAVFDLPPLVVAGTWAAMTIGLAFLAAYARRVIAEIFAMSQALTAAEEALGREQRLSDIGGLAAAAAHELGTPLATIKLASGELARELADRPDLAEDVELIRRQAERCRDILRDLSNGGKDDSHVKTAPIQRLVEEAAAPHRDRGKRLVLRIDGEPAGEAIVDQPVVVRRPEVVHGLRNLIQNAVDFADSTVWVDVDWTDATLRIAVGDDGPGYGPDVLGRLGEPWIRDRARRPRAPASAPAPAPSGRAGYEGMGLGLFIAKTLLERTGARVAFANGGDDDSSRERRAAAGDPETALPPGAIVAATWPRGALDPPPDLRRGSLRANEKFSLNTV